MQVRPGETIAQEGRAKPSRPDITCAPSAGMALPDPNLEKGAQRCPQAPDAEAALTWVDVVIQTLGVGFGDLFRLVRLFSDATRVLIAAVKAQGVKRLTV
jgi:hypothetical protein